jgi:uncharacterized membrane protein YfcA
MLVLALILSLVIGVALGALGGGGAILMLPMLVYVLHLDPKAAIATSLFVVGATSVVGTGAHARAHGVAWRIGAFFGAAAMGGAFISGRVAHRVPSTVLLVLFGLVMVTTAIAMLRGRSETTGDAPPLRVGRTLALGVAVGLVSGLVGAGGGFLIVPALTLFGGLPMRKSIGTSLFVIALQSFAGFAGHLAHVDVDWGLVLGITGVAVAGSIVGASVGKLVPASHLRQGFAWLVIAMGLFLFAKQLPPLAALCAGALTISAVLLTLRRRSPVPSTPFIS